MQENFEKSCQISFKAVARKESVRRCRRPVEKVCDGQGETVCLTRSETTCTTSQTTGLTSCSQVPVEVCGAGCTTREGPSQCREELVDTVMEVPEEHCDIIPRKFCHQVTRLVPALRPSEECGLVPSEVCTMNYDKKKVVRKPLRTEWCLEREGEA